MIEAGVRIGRLLEEFESSCGIDFAGSDKD